MRTRMVLGGLVALGFVVVSTIMAARFGWELGASETDRYLYAVAGGLADVLKALLPLFVVAAFVHGQYVRSFFAAVVFVVFTGYSLTASFGLAAIQSAEKVGSHNAAELALNDRREALDTLLAQRKALGVARATGAIEADIAAAKLDRLFDSSKQCTDATATKSRDLCQRIQSLEAERANAVKATGLDAQITTARAKYEAIDVTAATKEADPQAAALSRLTTYNKETIRTALHGLIAVLLELGSGLGFYLVFGHHGKREQAAKTEPPRPAQSTALATVQDAMIVEGPGDAVQRFVLERIRPVQGERVSGSELFAAYESWCEAQGLEPLSSALFGRVVPWRKERIGGRVWYLDAVLPASAGAIRVAVDNTTSETPRRLGHMARAS
mgnify:CR=1 FL=1